MSMNFSFRKTSIVASVAMLSMAMSGVVSAESFPVTAAVQTTVAITTIVGMNLGTIYAATAGGATADTHSAITMAPSGTLSAKVEGVSATKLPLIALGGHAPATATIVVSSTAPITLTLPVADTATAITAVGYGAAVNAFANKVMIAAADPAVAKFQLVGFTVGGVTGGTPGTPCDIGNDALNSCILTPAFGSTALNFAIGATILTETSATSKTYQPTTYTGSFTVTASY